MKTILFLGLIICLIIGRSAKQVRKFPWGAWKWVSAKHYSEGKLDKTYDVMKFVRAE
jgi:hypothetical protein